MSRAAPPWRWELAAQAGHVRRPGPLSSCPSTTASRAFANGRQAIRDSVGRAPRQGRPAAGGFAWRFVGAARKRESRSALCPPILPGDFRPALPPVSSSRLDATGGMGSTCPGFSRAPRGFRARRVLDSRRWSSPLAPVGGPVRPVARGSVGSASADPVSGFPEGPHGRCQRGGPAFALARFLAALWISRFPCPARGRPSARPRVF